MSPVGGSRHYQGGGLGVEGGWDCPSCGGENAGPIAQGCAVCGAGRPGRHIGTPPAAAPPPEPDEPEALKSPVADQPNQGATPPLDNAWTRWAALYPDATAEQAFVAGYVEGIRDSQRGAAAAARATRPARRLDPEAQTPFDREGKVVRTILAALSFFADQVLAGAPEEVEQGEWCSADEVRNLIHQLATTGEVHA